MTAITARAQLALVDIDVTLRALFRRVCINIVRMTLAAINLFMTAIQSIFSPRIVVKFLQWRPGLGGMTLVTWLTKLTLMKVVMTIGTRRINGFEMTLSMTACTGDRLVLTGQ
tara:strand:- start:1071 stop:1409 length:339 start_codon:yes stop_codon:yes gene_type:complete